MSMLTVQSGLPASQKEPRTALGDPSMLSIPFDMAATMTNVYDVERYCTYAFGGMDDQGNKPCKD